jgi:branched-subunit amino acid transport protein
MNALSKTLWIVVAGMTLATALLRVLPLLLLSGCKLPPVVTRWLSLIAPAILSALLLPELLFVNDSTPTTPVIASSNTFLLASIPAFLVAWRTKSLYRTVVTGIAAVALLRLL